MFARRFFGKRQFGPRYFGDGSNTPPIPTGPGVPNLARALSSAITSALAKVRKS